VFILSIASPLNILPQHDSDLPPDFVPDGDSEAAGNAEGKRKTARRRRIFSSIAGFSRLPLLRTLQDGSFFSRLILRVAAGPVPTTGRTHDALR
jgi:hypothetical protein